ncbi:MAG: fimbrillin family protein [Bacteroidales bacterium]|nr:fimbrillin family protein [Bacteroidales bacterium]
MKKSFFLAAVAITVLAGCAKNEPAQLAQEESITFFAPVVGPQTKVYGEIGANYNTGESFDVWCVHNTADITEWGGTAYFSDVEATYDSGLGGWTLSPKYYWPATGELSFVALSPSLDNTIAYDHANGFQITSAWSQGANQDAIVDLMYSEPTFNCVKASFVNAYNDNDDDSGDYKYNGVDINFKHALSYILFNVKTTANYSATTKFRLNTITLSGVYTTGTFNQKAYDPWTENTAGATGTYVAFTDTPGLEFGNSAVLAAAATGKEIILLPQELTAGQQKITVNYQISTDNGTTWIDQVQEVDLKNATVAEWEMGKKYTYNLSIGMTEIIFDPAVTYWSEVAGGDITF